VNDACCGKQRFSDISGTLEAEKDVLGIRSTDLVMNKSRRNID